MYTPTEFSQRYSKAMEMSLHEMIEVHHALCARITDLIFERKYSLTDPRVLSLQIVAHQLDGFINDAILQYEAEVAAEEAKALDDPNFIAKLANPPKEDQ